MYSFSILLLEIASSSADFVHSQFRLVGANAVALGYWRPEPPAKLVKSSPQLWELIKACWSIDSSDRPNFISIVKQLKDTKPDGGDNYLPTVADMEKLKADKDMLERNAIKGLERLLEVIEKKNTEIESLKKELEETVL